MLRIPLADNRELELTRERGRPAEAFRLAMFRRYASHRMSEGGFCCTRAELALLLMAWNRSTPGLICQRPAT
jgi:hypothetical protein